MKLSTWNVNGIRSAMSKGLRDYLLNCGCDIVCLQETKCEAAQIDLAWHKGYEVVWNCAEKKGYAGTCVLTRIPFQNCLLGMGKPEHDREGRVITLEFPEFFLVNVYTPNSKAGLVRLPYRMKWDDHFRHYLKKLEKTKPVLICGDLNCAHTEIDLANPKSNRKNAGFSDEERASFGKHLAAGFIDVFREFDQSPGRYTWWTMRTGGSARKKNIGWRIDYWLASKALRKKIQSCTILSDVFGSDHCPVEIEIATS